MAETNFKWYVLRAVSGKETKVKDFIEAAKKLNTMLERNVSQVLIPMEKQAVLKRGKRVIKEKTSMPGYILVEANLNPEVAHALRFMPNVLGFLGRMDNPAPCKQSDINRFINAVEDTETLPETDITYVVGDAIKVIDGPFSGFSGVVEEVNTDKLKLKVTVKIFGRKTPLELSYTQVEKE